MGYLDAMLGGKSSELTAQIAKVKNPLICSGLPSEARTKERKSGFLSRGADVVFKNY
ncbi:hypothetical protein [Vibrio furnissii]|uniref:hypothetical protein n=1 Tax=Vibrio furnissii TaxID=29494 RepID=UPI0037501CD7